MFCKIKKIRNWLILATIVMFGFYFYESNKEYVLYNENAVVSTKIKDKAMILFVDLGNRNNPKLNQENFTAMVLVGKAYNLFKNNMRIIAVVNSPDERILRELNMAKKTYEFDMEIFFDENGKFSRKFGILKKPTTVLINNNKIQYKTENYMFRWSDIEGIKLISEHLGISLGL